MKIGKIFQTFGGLLLFAFIGTVVFDLVFTFTWPFKAGTITYIIWQNRMYLFLFLLYMSISVSYMADSENEENEYNDNAIIGWLSIIALSLSIAITAVVDIVFTFTWPFKADTYTYKWWNLLWEYKLYIFIGFLIIAIIDLIIANSDKFEDEQEPIQPRRTNTSQTNNNQNMRSQRVVRTTMLQISADEQYFLDYLKENPNTPIDESVLSLYNISQKRALELQKHLKK